MAPRAVFAGGAHAERRTFRLPGGFAMHAIALEGLSATVTDILVQVQDLAGATQTERLRPTRPSFVVKAGAGTGEVALAYLWLGIEPILFGFDHLLFVIALVRLVLG